MHPSQTPGASDGADPTAIAGSETAANAPGPTPQGREAHVLNRLGQLHFEPWLEALQHVARHYRLPASTERVRHAAEWDQLSDEPEMIRNIARQIGLQIKLGSNNAAQLSSWNLPVVLRLTDGRVGVLTALGTSFASLAFSGDHGLESPVPIEALEGKIDMLLIPRPARAVPDQRIDAYIRPYEENWLRRIVMRDMRPYCHVMLASFVANVLGLTGILFSMQVYDRVVPAQSFPTLYVLFSGVVLAIAFDFLMRRLRMGVIDLLGKRADLRMSDQVFGHALRVKNRARPASTGTFIAQLRDLEQVRELLTSTTVAALADVPFVLLFLVLFWHIGGIIVLVPLVAVVLMVIPGLLAQRRIRIHASEAMRESSLRNAMLVEAVQGIEDIKTLQAEERFQQQWNHFNAVSGEAQIRSRSIANTLTVWTQSVQTGVYAVTVFVGAPMVIAGDMTTGALVGASMLGSRMIAPMAQTTQILTRLQHAKVAMRSLNQLMKLPVDHPDQESRIELQSIRGNYRMHSAVFRYGEENAPPALTVRDLTIRPGEHIALLGKNGAGKSTLLQALSGLLEASSGEVLLESVSMAQVDPADVRRDIGLLTQNARLFYGTIRDNITLGAPHASGEEILSTLAMVGADDFIRKLPKGLEHILLEGGYGLSGGQRQALLLARLLIRKPTVVLLDEPTAAMDEATERNFIRYFRDWSAGRTVVIATHRMRVIELVERMIVVDGGTIALDDSKENALRRLAGNAGAKPAADPTPPPSSAEPAEAQRPATPPVATIAPVATIVRPVSPATPASEPPAVTAIARPTESAVPQPTTDRPANAMPSQSLPPQPSAPQAPAPYQAAQSQASLSETQQPVAHQAQPSPSQAPQPAALQAQPSASQAPQPSATPLASGQTDEHSPASLQSVSADDTIRPTAPAQPIAPPSSAARPVTSEPTEFQPATSLPASSQPTSQSAPSQPAPSHPATSQPVAPVQAAVRQPGAHAFAQPAPRQPATAQAHQPTPTHPVARQPIAGQPAAAHPTAARTAAPQPTSTRPAHTQAAASRPAATQPATSRATTPQPMPRRHEVSPAAAAPSRAVADKPRQTVAAAAPAKQPMPAPQAKARMVQAPVAKPAAQAHRKPVAIAPPVKTAAGKNRTMPAPAPTKTSAATEQSRKPVAVPAKGVASGKTKQMPAPARAPAVEKPRKPVAAAAPSKAANIGKAKPVSAPARSAKTPPVVDKSRKPVAVAAPQKTASAKAAAQKAAPGKAKAMPAPARASKPAPVAETPRKAAASKASAAAVVGTKARHAESANNAPATARKPVPAAVPPKSAKQVAASGNGKTMQAPARTAKPAPVADKGRKPAAAIVPQKAAPQTSKAKTIQAPVARNAKPVAPVAQKGSKAAVNAAPQKNAKPAPTSGKSKTMQAPAPVAKPAAATTRGKPAAAVIPAKAGKQAAPATKGKTAPAPAARTAKPAPVAEKGRKPAPVAVPAKTAKPAVTSAKASSAAAAKPAPAATKRQPVVAAPAPKTRKAPAPVAAPAPTSRSKQVAAAKPAPAPVRSAKPAPAPFKTDKRATPAAKTTTKPTRKTSA